MRDVEKPMRMCVWIFVGMAALICALSVAATKPQPKPAAKPQIDPAQEHANEETAKSTEIATPQQVQNAIERAVKFIYSQQNKDGTWETTGEPTGNLDGSGVRNSPGKGQYAGRTALAVYALLSAGEDYKDPKLSKAIKFLEDAPMQGVYAIGMRCLVWHMMPDDDSDHQALLACLQRDKDLLEKAQQPESLMYNYLVSEPDKQFDHSVSQYGVLGMWAVQESGQEVSLKYWESIVKAWENAQNPDGGWDYGRFGPMKPAEPSEKPETPAKTTGSTKKPAEPKKPETPKKPALTGTRAESTPTMTAAGIATLFLAQDEIMEGTSAGACKGNQRNEHIDHALEWMDKNFMSLFGVPKAMEIYYGLYGLERIGVASGRIYFGETNWFNHGANFLVHEQKPNGSWGDDINTSFGLLFLARGRAPVTINKLQYFNEVGGKREEGDWNERPRDVANFNPWLAGQVELGGLVNWQVVNLDATDEDLHSAPLLLVTGSRALAFSAEDEKRLKRYIDLGGTVLFNADCASPAFTKSVIHLGTKIYPHSEFRPLTEDHPIFHHEVFILKPGDVPPKVLGLSNGVREMMILVPDADLSRSWQGRRALSEHDNFTLGCNILMYASDKTGIVFKGVTHLVQPDPKITTDATLKVARIRFNGAWDPEPFAWSRMAAIMHNKEKIDLDVKEITPGSSDLSDFKVAVLTGTGTPHITDAGWAELEKFVKDGGTLIADNAGGAPNSPFTTAVHDRLAAFAGATDQLDTPIPPADPFYAATGPALKEIHYRPYSRQIIADMSTPNLRAIKYGDRIGVFFSGEDLTAGLVGEHIDGIIGYEPEYASLLMEKMLLYAQAHAK